MSAADSYQVWTDGACSKNPGEGGWAFFALKFHYRYQTKTFC